MHHNTPADLLNQLQVVDLEIFIRREKPRGLSALIGRLVNSEEPVMWKRHGIVVSNRPIKRYRGSSLPVTTPHALSLIAMLEWMESELLPDAPHPMAFYFGRLGQTVNDAPKDIAVMDLLQAVRRRLQALLLKAS